MRGRIFTVLCLFACALFSGTAGALDGTGSGTLQEKITIRGCETGLESRAVTLRNAIHRSPINADY